jgi:hypothetical protein
MALQNVGRSSGDRPDQIPVDDDLLVYNGGTRVA